MQINISGRKINVGDALRTHIEERMTSIADKYFSRSIDASVTVAKEGHLFRIDAHLHPNQGIDLQARGEGSDAHGAFESAADRIEKQLRRYKRRITNHHANGQGAWETMPAQSYVLAADAEEGAGEDEAHGAEDQPIIIAEAKTQIPHVSVRDAVMLMDLADAPAFMFRNAKNDRLNVVYRRADGNIGWIDPADTKD